MDVVDTAVTRNYGKRLDMSNTLYLSLYIKTDKTDLEFISGPQRSYPTIRGLDQIIYQADFTWPRRSGKYKIYTGLSQSPDLPPTGFSDCGKRELSKGCNVRVDWAFYIASVSTS